MNMINLIPFIYSKFILFVFILTRISALFATFVVFRRQRVDSRILLGLSVLLSIYVMLFYQKGPVYYDFFTLKVLLEIAYQSLIGFLSGLVLNIVFEVFSAVGQIVSTQTGLSLASVIDPSMGTITSLTQFYSFSIMLVFLLLDGHLFIIKTIVDSFSIIPVGHYLSFTQSFSTILDYSSVIFTNAIMLSITVIIAILVTNFSLAVMTRFAPQFNIFSIGINLTLILGLISVYVTFELLINRGADFIQQNLLLLQSTILGLK